jgi:NhaP-type Na+/H+ or K+/H+ antiporter
MKKTLIVTTLILCLVAFQTAAFGETKDDKSQTVTDEQISTACTLATVTVVATTAVVNPVAGAIATVVAIPVKKKCEQILKNVRDKKKKTKSE